MEEVSQSTPPSGDVSRVVEHFFRHESARVIATLARVFGPAHLDLAEDVVQEALVRALQTWPFYGIPQNPSGWVMQAAKNLALDRIRREKNFRSKESAIIGFLEQLTDTPRERGPSFDDEISDDQLRMMFVCCHPEIPPEAQIALALKTLCGFGVQEIAQAFLTTEANIAKRLVRARKKIRDSQIPFSVPPTAELSARLEGVWRTLYLLFNEGYKASSGSELIRSDLCADAVRLTQSLAAHPIGDRPQTHALLALMLFNAARLSARMDAAGNILLLEEQDRLLWDKQMIARGFLHFGRCAEADAITEYHLEAGIAACHCAAADFASTDWPRILVLYDDLVKLDDSPIVALNRAVAVANVHGPSAGLDAVKAIRGQDKLRGYHLYYAVMGEFESRLQNFSEAARNFRQALTLTPIESERTFLKKRIEVCKAAEERGVHAT